MNPNRRITRSSTDRMIGGVCGGLASYLNIDPTLIRIGFVLLTLAGVSPLVYIILWVVLPLDTAAAASWGQQVQQAVGEMQERATTVAHEVSSQVQKLSGSGDTGTSSTGEGGPSTGPTTRL